MVNFFKLGKKFKRKNSIKINLFWYTRSQIRIFTLIFHFFDFIKFKIGTAILKGKTMTNILMLRRNMYSYIVMIYRFFRKDLMLKDVCQFVR